MSFGAVGQFGVANKLELGARAAELRERLLKNRDQKQEHPGRAASAPNETKTTSRSHSVTSDQPTDPGNIKTEDTTTTLYTDLGADEEDIHQLITSISSELVNDAAARSAPQTPDTSLLSGLSKETASSHTKRPHKLTPPTSSDLPLATSNRKTPSEKTPPQEGEDIRGNIQKKSMRNSNHTANHQTSSSNHPSIIPVTNKPRQSLVEKSPEPSATKGHQYQSAVTESTSKNPSTSNSPAQQPPKRGMDSTDAAEPPSSERRNQPSQPASMQAPPRQPTSSSATTQSSPRSLASPALAQLLKEDKDLRDWLDMTGYFDVDVRNRKLQRARKLAEFEAEKNRIEEARRKLLEEDALDNPFGRSPLATLLPKQLGEPNESQPTIPAKRKAVPSPISAHPWTGEILALSPRPLVDITTPARALRNAMLAPGWTATGVPHGILGLQTTVKAVIMAPLPHGRETGPLLGTLHQARASTMMALAAETAMPVTVTATLVTGA
ncbi:hypothetical protein GQ53DRAFT_833964 [Thozetella sp. PMI_491]|nr:hypothetical protein GQ53DRAFT_833964 [Thozetella sp. PMI_491]